MASANAEGPLWEVQANMANAAPNCDSSSAKDLLAPKNRLAIAVQAQAMEYGRAPRGTDAREAEGMEHAQDLKTNAGHGYRLFGRDDNSRSVPGPHGTARGGGLSERRHAFVRPLYSRSRKNSRLSCDLQSLSEPGLPRDHRTSEASQAFVGSSALVAPAQGGITKRGGLADRA